MVNVQHIPDLFGNESAVDIKEWFKKFELSTLNLPSREKIRILELRTEDRAKAITREAIGIYGREEYVQIKNMLWDRLSNLDNKKLISRNRLYNGIGIKPNESIDEFGYRVLSLVRTSMN
jgi:hypothetical protein